jgi:hypothetical protein
VRGRADARLAEYVNVPRTLAAVVSAGKATLHELDTVYGQSDLWDMLEIIMIDGHNQGAMAGKG